MTSLQEVISDIGWLIAGSQTARGDVTLRKLKPQKYAPTSEFGKWLEGTVAHAIENAKLKSIREEFDLLLITLKENDHLIPEAQNEIERIFIENFGRGKVVSNEYLDKVLGDSKITKLSVAAKLNGVNKVTVDYLINVGIRNVLERSNILTEGGSR